MNYEYTFPVLNNPSYQILKWISLVVLPAAAAFYYNVGNIWGWPHVEHVVGTIASTEVFFGAVLGVSTRFYYKSDDQYDGNLDIVENGDGTKTFGLNLSDMPEELEAKKSINFKVNKIDPSNP